MPACSHCWSACRLSSSSESDDAHSSRYATALERTSCSSVVSGRDCSGRWKTSNATSCSTCSASGASAAVPRLNGQSSSRSHSCASTHASEHSSVHACRRAGVASVAPAHSRRTIGASADGGGAPAILLERTSDRQRLSSAWVVPSSAACCSAARQAAQHSGVSASRISQPLASATAWPDGGASSTATLARSCATSSGGGGGGSC